MEDLYVYPYYQCLLKCTHALLYVRTVSTSTQTGGDQSGKAGPSFVFTYLPPPVLLLLVFSYKLIMRTHMVKLKDMFFDDVQFVTTEAEEPKPKSRLDRVSWFLFK